MLTMYQVPVPKLSSADHTHVVEVNWEALPESTKEYIILYGLKQAYNDRLADPKYSGKAAMERVNWVHERILDGTIGIRRKAEPTNPFEAFVERQIIAKLKEKKIVRKPDPEAFDAKLAELLSDVLEDESKRAKLKAAFDAECAAKLAKNALSIDLPL